MLAGTLAVLTGHSGVGKSSLLNALTEHDQARVGGLNEGTGKGRQTTTASRLYHLKNGARIIDTPGIREFGLGPVTLDEIKAAFPGSSEGSGASFNDCTHKDAAGTRLRDSRSGRTPVTLRAGSGSWTYSLSVGRMAICIFSRS